MSWNIWPFLDAVIEVDYNTSTEVIKGDVVDDACKIRS